MPEDDPLFGYIERFTAVLVAAGMPSMASRVFVALLVSEDGLTAAELSESLRVSPAAVSGGLRYLVPLGMVLRERVPGSRRDRYSVPEDVWSMVLRMRDPVMSRWAGMLREGRDLVGDDSPAGRRLAAHGEFFDFVVSEWDELFKHWEQRSTRPRLTPPGGLKVCSCGCYTNEKCKLSRRLTGAVSLRTRR
jgi:predicted transcriptional regulator